MVQTGSLYIPASEFHIGALGGTTPRVTGQMIRGADATTYTIGDHIANSTTAASVTPITFTSAARITGGSGRISGVRCVQTAASGTIVLPSFDLLIFRPNTNIPFANAGFPADNAVCNITSAAYNELVGVFQFAAASWRNQLGGSTAAGLVAWQVVSVPVRAYAPFNLASVSSANLVAIMQAQSAWVPGAVVNTFDFALDIDQD